MYIFISEPAYSEPAGQVYANLLLSAIPCGIQGGSPAGMRINLLSYYNNAFIRILVLETLNIILKDPPYIQILYTI